MIILGCILCATIWGVHKVSHKILSDEEVQQMIFNDSEFYTTKHTEEQNVLVHNTVHVITCVLLLVFLLVTDADIALLYVLSQVFTCGVLHTELVRSEKALLLIGGLLYWGFRSPHAERMVFYSLFSLPMFSYRVVEHHLRGYTKGLMNLHQVLLVWFMTFWLMSVWNFHHSPNVVDTALLPVTFYFDVNQWNKILTELSKVRKLH